MRHWSYFVWCLLGKCGWLLLTWGVGATCFAERSQARKPSAESSHSGLTRRFVNASGTLGQSYRFDRWTTDNGLPQNSVSAILQTRDGYLWLTTSDGLVRYDGVRFTVFNKGNTPAILGNRLTGLYEAMDGTLWAGTEENGIITYRNGIFRSYTVAQGLPSNNAPRIFGDAAGNILVGTDSGPAWWRDGRFVPLAQPRQTAAEAAAAYLEPDGTLWQIRDNGTLSQTRHDDTQTYQFPFAVLPASLPRLYMKDSTGRLWFAVMERIGYWQAGVFHYLDFSSLSLDFKPGVSDLQEDKAGNIWLATGNVGLICWHTDGRFSRYSAADGMGVGPMQAFYEDREGSFWLGFSGSGLSRMTRRFITSLAETQGLTTATIYPLYQDRAGDIWLGTNGGPTKYANNRLTFYPMKYQTTSPYSRESLKYPSYDPQRNLAVTAYTEDREGHLWVGCWYRIFTFKDGVATDRFDLFGRKLIFWDIYQDRAGALWFATSGGLFRLQSGQMTHWGQSDGLPTNDVRVIHEARDGTFWLGTVMGLVRWHGKVFTTFTSRDGVAGELIRTIYEEPDGTLWIGTYDSGLSRYKDGRFTTYNTKNGLFNDGVFAILEDRRGYFWMSSNNGIHRTSKQQLNDLADGKITMLTSSGYGKEDGMLNAECNGGRQPAALQAPDGKFWFPTQNGVAIVDPDAVPYNQLPPPLALETIKIDNQPVAPSSAEPDTIQLEPYQNNLEINYTALSFIRPAQVQFKYQLIGQDADWVNVGTRRTAYYSYLPPGTYLFRVSAANADGVWNNEGAQIVVRVRPPFYRTWWFIALAVLSSAGLISLAFLLRLRQLGRTHALREAFSHQTLAAQEAFSRQLIASQEAERQRIAAELHDGLGQNLLVIKNRALLGSAVLTSEALSQEHFAGIGDAATQALTEVRSIAYNLRPYHLDRLGLNKALTIMLDDVALATNINIIADIALLDNLLPKEAEIHLYRIVQECLSNIIKHSAATTAYIALQRRNNNLTIHISDNGRGFTPTLRPATTQSDGFGLLGLSERVRLLGGTQQIESSPGQGTRITIQLRTLNFAPAPKTP